MAVKKQTGGIRITEAEEQEAVFEWCELAAGKHPELKLLYHVPNGGSRNVKEAANLKRQGVKAGVPDLCLPVARLGYHGLYIEMKAADGKPSALQKEWMRKLWAQGYAAEICYSAEEAIEVLKQYVNGR